MKFAWIGLILFVAACSDDKGPATPLNNNENNQNNLNNISTDTGMDTGTNNNTPDMPAGDCTVDGCPSGLLCNENTGQCVNCQFDTECGENGSCSDEGLCECATDFHSCNGQCVSNTDVATCGSSCTPCDKPANGIATCDGTACGVLCDTPFVPFEGQCVTCATNEQCANPAEPRCDAGTCVACSDNTHCAHFAEAKICNDTGSCVECESNADCGGNVCITSTGTCTTTAPNSVSTCMPCSATDACIAGHVCMPMEFQGNAHGNYCLPTRGADECPSPWVFQIQRAPVDRAMATACGPNEAETTCEAVLVFGEFCPSGQDSECGAQGLNDGRCEPVGFDSVLMCTYTCTSGAECRETGNSDIDGVGCISADYCGGI